MSDWNLIRIGDYCLINQESYNSKEVWSFVNYLDTGNITKNNIDEIQYIDLTKEKLPSRAKRKVKRNSILFSTVRPNQRHYGIIKQQPDNFLVSTGFTVLDANEEVLDPDFLYYVLTSDNIVEGLHAIAEQSTSAYPSIRPSDIENILVSVPDIKTQRKISSILIDLDEKIKLNNEINKNLAALIETIYCNEFDIVNHKADGVLSDICQYSTEKVSVSELSLSTYFSTENMQPNKTGSVDATNLPSISQTTKCHKGDVLISNIRPYFKKIIYVTDDCGCSTDVLCFTPKDSAFSTFLFGTLYVDRFFDYMVAGSKGTKMPRGDKQQIMNYPIVLPSTEALANFNGLVLPILDLIASNRSENSRLVSLRDTLLPKLMSGEMYISDIEI